MKLEFEKNKTLIIQLKKGNEKAYEYLVNRFHKKLCTYATSLTNNPIIAEDIVQNVLIKTWEKREHLKTEYLIDRYLYKSVYNEFIDHYRKRQSTLTLENKFNNALERTLEENELMIDKYIKLVNKEICNLPPKCKQVFILSKKEGLTNMEISEYLNISIKTVEGQVTKAFSILRKNLKHIPPNILFITLGL
ncbi:RNA polymerase sigma factor [Aquimarina sediminis]|uniref:RNA polymerase sigma factor n=1 Tax=Aquimarina sediminis TaxID=2070536 RepID=UPI000CA00632|nr:RNA polymerase sigma-70 factor [Aquimarina sediminis]